MTASPDADPADRPGHLAASHLAASHLAAPGSGTSGDPDGGPGWGRPRGTPTTTLLLRHGQTELSIERRFAGREDTPLTREGIRQAERAASSLAGAGIDVIVSSPLRRARRTAEAVAEATGAPLTIYDEMAEADFGSWQGLTFGEAAEKWPDEMSAWMTSPDAAPPGGESFAAVAARVLAGLDRLIAGYPRQRVVVVSHVTPIKTLVCRALLAPPDAMFRINLDVASLCHIDCFDDGSALVRSLNDTSHLSPPRRLRFRPVSRAPRGARAPRAQRAPGP